MQYPTTAPQIFRFQGVSLTEAQIAEVSMHSPFVQRQKKRKIYFNKRSGLSLDWIYMLQVMNYIQVKMFQPRFILNFLCLLVLIHK